VTGIGVVPTTVLISVLIAGTYTPFGLLAVSGTASATLLSAIWARALAALALHLPWAALPKWLSAVLYVPMGWVGVISFPHLAADLGWPVPTLLLGGGILYSFGAAVYALRWPNPRPHGVRLPRGLPRPWWSPPPHCTTPPSSWCWGSELTPARAFTHRCRVPAQRPQRCAMRTSPTRPSMSCFTRLPQPSVGTAFSAFTRVLLSATNLSSFLYRFCLKLSTRFCQ
jgi:Haemolysin-III related